MCYRPRPFFKNTITLHPHILWSDSGIFPAEIKSAIRLHENVGTLTFSLEDILAQNAYGTAELDLSFSFGKCRC